MPEEAYTVETGADALFINVPVYLVWLQIILYVESQLMINVELVLILMSNDVACNHGFQSVGKSGAVGAPCCVVDDNSLFFSFFELVVFSISFDSAELFFFDSFFVSFLSILS